MQTQVAVSDARAGAVRRRRISCTDGRLVGPGKPLHRALVSCGAQRVGPGDLNFRAGVVLCVGLHMLLR